MRSTYWLGSVLLALAVAFTGLGCDDGGGTDCSTVLNSCDPPGAVQCNATNTGTERCEDNADGCPVWTAYEACQGAQVCSAGLCRCDNECATAGDTQCSGSVVQTCVADALGCLAWDDTTDCATGGQLCEDATGTAVCADVCTDECPTVNETQCEGNTVETCQLGNDGCNDWVVTDTCGADEQCLVTGGTAACECVPDCTARECGDDGCGGSCGTCDAGEECDADGLCQVVCVPDCTGLECGDDGCGGSCGDCTAPEVCILATGQCEDCTPDCTGRECGVDPVCGASCGTCLANEECDANGVCQPVCVPDCTGLECGDDGCGGSCGACTAPEVCVLATGQCEDCTPDCTGLECGPDPVCGASCGECTAPETCDASGQCVCVPDCTGLECGDDGCGGSCGECTAPEVCVLATGQCEACTPVCDGLECGDDGCGGSCGECTAPETCDANGQCVCTPDCTGRECGDDGCGGSCGSCTAPETCDANGQCVGGGSCTEAIVDGGFEGGTPSTAWTETSTNYGTPLCDEASCGVGGGTGPYAGTFWAWFGGFGGGPEDGTVSQSVTLPAGETVTLFFFLEIPVSEGLATDFLEVTVDGTQVFLVDGSMAAQYQPYTLVQVDLSAYADGAAHTLVFHGYTNSGAGAATNFFVDDVSVGVGGACCIGECNAGDPNVCRGDAVYACVVDANGCGTYTLDIDCSLAGDICQNGACVGCVDTCGPENATQCAGQIVETCTLGANGCLGWVAGEDCSLTPDTFCISGACQTVACQDIGSQLGTFPGDNTGYPNTMVPSCTTNESAGEVCFTWTAPADGVFVMDTEGSTGTNDTILAVLDAGGAEVACDDDGGTGWLSALQLTAVNGTVYTIIVDTWSNAVGAFNLNISAQICAPGATQCNADGVTLETCNATGTAWVSLVCPGGCDDTADPAVCLPAGNTCAEALTALDGITPVTNLGNTDSFSGYSCSTGRTGADTWHAYTATVSGTYWVATSGPGNITDTVLAVFDACGGTQLGCDDDSGEGLYSLVTVDMVAGSTYYIVTEPYSTTGFGTWNLSIVAALPESICDDWEDNDMDGTFDCGDATDCQTMAECTPVAGAVAAGQACVANNGCVASANDPACLLEDMGWPLGYCSEFCSLAGNDCPAGALCTDLGLGGDVGLCMDLCDPVGDPCRADTFVDPNGQTVSYVCYAEYGNICGPSWWGGK